MIKRLGEIASFQRGLTYSKGDEAPLSTKCVLRSNNIDLESSSLDLSEIKYLRDDFIIPEDRKLKANSIFICMSNGSKQHVGKVAFIEKDMDYAFGGFMGLIVPSPEVSAKYVFYACQSSAYRTFLSQVGNGIGITNLRFSDLEKFEFPVPSLSEQQRIVAELDLLSGIVEKKNAQLGILDELALSLYNEMVGPLSHKSSGWPKKKLKDVCSFFRGLTYAKPDEVPFSKKVVLRSNNVDLDSHSLILGSDELKYLRDDFVVPEEKKVKKDSILMCMSNGSRQHVGKVAYIDKDYDYAFGGFMGLIKPNGACNSRYVFYSLLTSDFKSFLNIVGEGIGILNLKFSTLGDYQITVPPAYLQESFAEKVSEIERQKRFIQESLSFACDLLSSRVDNYFCQY